MTPGRPGTVSWTPAHQELAEKLYARGLSHRQIAAVLDVHRNTVHRHLGSAYTIRYAYQRGLIDRFADDLGYVGVDAVAALESLPPPAAPEEEA